MLKVLKPFAGPAAIVTLEVGLGMSGLSSPFWGGLLVGVAVFWFVLARFSNRALLKRAPTLLEWMPFLDPSGGFASADQLTGKFIQGQTFHIYSIQHDGVIRGRH